MNASTLGDIGLFICGSLCGGLAVQFFHEVRTERHVQSLIREVKRSQRICAWCNRPLGVSDTASTSHGICDSCASDLLKQLADEK